MAAATDEAILLRVVHDIPGRLRLRLSPEVGAESVADAAARIDGVVECRWSPLTRGLLADVIVGEVARHVAPGEAPEAVSAAASPRPATLGDAVKVTFAEIDDRLRTASYGQVGLSGLVTFALAGWGMAGIFRGRVAPLAWSSAFWYAHGLFRDYHVSPPDAVS
jgi:hypothetical protein